jgi:hypothetical protein
MKATESNVESNRKQQKATESNAENRGNQKSSWQIVQAELIG